MILGCDFETRSTVELKVAGVYVYAAHPSTEILCMAWAFDDDEPAIWIPGAAFPSDVEAHAVKGGEMRAWNASFERLIWKYKLDKIVRDGQWVCTAAEAAAMALPRSLDQCARVLKVKEQKDEGGHRLMMQLSRPRKIVDGKPVWWTDADKLDRLYEYCRQDVRTECGVAKALRRLTPAEREIYLLDQRINDRGVQIDRPLIVAAKDVAEEGVRRANLALTELTDGQVTRVTNHASLTAWLQREGVETQGVSKPAVQEMLNGELIDRVRQVLQVRVDAGRSSVAKLDSFLAAAAPDDRVRGLLLYHGASTGRWTGKLIQPQNFPRGTVPDVERFIPGVLACAYEALNLFYHPITILSSMLRSMLIAAPGHSLIGGDYSAIECRVLNWLAGETDVLDSFRAYDHGDKSHDPYIIMARRIGPDVPRQSGKAAELGCGFQMGPKKYITAAWQVYQIRVTPEQAKAAVVAYRKSHAKVVDFWYETERACLAAIAAPGQVQVFGGQRNLKVIVAGAYLYIILPSGRPLCYAAPEAREREVVIEDENGEEKRFRKVGMEYAGMDSQTRQWGRLRAYGGFLVENIVQAVARDIMAEAMLRLEKAALPVVLSVHDEIVAEVEATGEGVIQSFESLLTTHPAWAAGLPIAAEGWIGQRYRK